MVDVAGKGEVGVATLVVATTVAVVTAADEEGRGAEDKMVAVAMMGEEVTTVEVTVVEAAMKGEEVMTAEVTVVAAAEVEEVVTEVVAEVVVEVTAEVVDSSTSCTPSLCRPVPETNVRHTGSIYANCSSMADCQCLDSLHGMRRRERNPPVERKTLTVGWVHSSCRLLHRTLTWRADSILQLEKRHRNNILQWYMSHRTGHQMQTHDKSQARRC